MYFLKDKYAKPMKISSQQYFYPPVTVKDILFLDSTQYFLISFVEIDLEALPDDFAPTVGTALYVSTSLNYLRF